MTFCDFELKFPHFGICKFVFLSCTLLNLHKLTSNSQFSGQFALHLKIKMNSLTQSADICRQQIGTWHQKKTENHYFQHEFDDNQFLHWRVMSAKAIMSNKIFDPYLHQRVYFCSDFRPQTVLAWRRWTTSGQLMEKRWFANPYSPSPSRCIIHHCY